MAGLKIDDLSNRVVFGYRPEGSAAVKMETLFFQFKHGNFLENHIEDVGYIGHYDSATKAI